LPWLRPSVGSSAIAPALLYLRPSVGSYGSRSRNVLPADFHLHQGSVNSPENHRNIPVFSVFFCG